MPGQLGQSISQPAEGSTNRECAPQTFWRVVVKTSCPLGSRCCKVRDTSAGTIRKPTTLAHNIFQNSHNECCRAYRVDESNKIFNYASGACIGDAGVSCCVSVDSRRSDDNRFLTTVETTKWPFEWIRTFQTASNSTLPAVWEIEKLRCVGKQERRREETIKADNDSTKAGIVARK